MNKPLEANLILHCGGHQIEHEDLKRIQTPDPVGIWHPLDHDFVYDLMTQTLITAGYRIMQVIHAVSAAGANYFGLAQINADYLDTDDYGLVVGWRNSHAKQFSASMIAGSSLFICDNLSFSGEVSFKHKHTTNVRDRLPEVFAQGIGTLSSLYTNQDRQFAAYKSHALEDNRVERMVIDLYRQNHLTTQELGKIIDVYDEPTYEEYGEGTAWTFFNAVTEVLKGKLGRIPRATLGLHTILDGECRRMDNELVHE